MLLKPWPHQLHVLVVNPDSHTQVGRQRNWPGFARLPLPKRPPSPQPRLAIVAGEDRLPPMLSAQDRPPVVTRPIPRLARPRCRHCRVELVRHQVAHREVAGAGRQVDAPEHLHPDEDVLHPGVEPQAPLGVAADDVDEAPDLAQRGRAERARREFADETAAAGARPRVPPEEPPVQAEQEVVALQADGDLAHGVSLQRWRRRRGAAAAVRRQRLAAAPQDPGHAVGEGVDGEAEREQGVGDAAALGVGVEHGAEGLLELAGDDDAVAVLFKDGLLPLAFWFEGQRFLCCGLRWLASTAQKLIMFVGLRS